MSIGNSEAKITVKVFSSLTCPHCANFHNKIFKKLKKEFIDNNKVKYDRVIDDILLYHEKKLINSKLFQIWTHCEHSDKVLSTSMSILESIIIFELLYFAHHMLT